MKLLSRRYCICTFINYSNTFFPLFLFWCFPFCFIFWLKFDVMIFLCHNNCKMLLISPVFPFLLFILLCTDPLANWWDSSREFWVWDFCKPQVDLYWTNWWVRICYKKSPQFILIIYWLEYWGCGTIVQIIRRSRLILRTGKYVCSWLSEFVGSVSTNPQPTLDQKYI